MEITEAAEARLQSLLTRSGADARGFRVSGVVGTCRGSTPVIKPAASATEDEVTVRASSLFFFASPDLGSVLEKATLDYDGRILGRGLTLTWPHQAGGCPGCR